MIKKIIASIILILFIILLGNTDRENKNKESISYSVNEDLEILMNNIPVVVLPEPVEETTTISVETEMQNRIGNIVSTSTVDWFRQYKAITEEYPNISTPSIYNSLTKDEITLLLLVVQAEIGDYSFEQKCNVASVIFNRLNSERFPNTVMDVLTSDQFESIANGRIYRVTVDEETMLACEYVFLFGDTTNGCLFFDSNGSLNYVYQFNDGAHNFYILP